MDYQKKLEEYAAQVAEWNENRARNEEFTRQLEAELARVNERVEILTAEKQGLEESPANLEEIPAVSRRIAEIDAELALLGKLAEDRKARRVKELKPVTGWEEKAGREAREFAIQRALERAEELNALLRGWSGGADQPSVTSVPTFVPDPGWSGILKGLPPGAIVLGRNFFTATDPLIRRAWEIATCTFPEGRAVVFLEVLRAAVEGPPPSAAKTAHDAEAKPAPALAA